MPHLAWEVVTTGGKNGAKVFSACLAVPPKRLVDDFHRVRGPRSCDSSIGVMKSILIQMVRVCVGKFNDILAGTSKKTALAARVKRLRPVLFFAKRITQA